MKNQTFDLMNFGHALGREEMRKLMAGSGCPECPTCTGGCSGCFSGCSETRSSSECGKIQAPNGGIITCYRVN